MVDIELIGNKQLCAAASHHFIHLWDFRSSQNTCELLLSSGVRSNTNFEPYRSRVSNELPQNEKAIQKLHCFKDHYLLSASGNTVNYWDLRNTKFAMGSLMTQNKEVCSFASNQKYCFTGDRFHTIKKFEIADMLSPDRDNPDLHNVNYSHNFKPPHFDAVTEILVSFAYDSTLSSENSDSTMFSSSRDGMIKKWSLDTNSESTKKYNAHNKLWITDMCWVHSSRNSLRKKYHPSKNTSNLLKAATANSGNHTNSSKSNSEFIASVGRDRSLKIWSVEDLDIICEVNDAHSKYINCVSSYDDLIFTGSDDFGINVYQLAFE